MSVLNKEFTYRFHKFNIKIELNTRITDSDKYHTIFILEKSLDGYYKKDEVNDKHIEIGISDFERYAKKYVDEKLDGQKDIDIRLSNLGFS